jgi:transposase
MRGEAPKQSSMLCVISPESMVPHDHPLRAVKKLADAALVKLSPVFDEMYAQSGRKSIPPERLLKALLLQALFSVRSETQLCEQLRYNMLFRWFLDMDMTEEVFVRSSFTKNRERMLDHEVTAQFFIIVVEQARSAGLMSSEHFSVDGTLIQAWGSLKSFRPKGDDDQDDNNGWGGFKGETRKNDTHESKTDPDAKLWRKGKGKEAKLCYGANALMENRNGLIVDFRIDEITGTLERDAALDMIAENVTGQCTVGGDKGYDSADFVEDLRELDATPHIAQNISSHRGSNIDGRTTRHAGYAISQVKRKLIEQIFGWMKTVGGMGRSRFRGLERTRLTGSIVAAAYNLLRMSRLIQDPA